MPGIIESSDWRALTTEEERFIREFILQWKLGKVNRSYFEKKFELSEQRYGPLSTMEARW